MTLKKLLLLLSFIWGLNTFAQLSTDSLPVLKHLTLPEPVSDSSHLSKLDFTRIIDTTKTTKPVELHQMGETEKKAITTTIKHITTLDSTYVESINFLNKYYSSHRQAKHDTIIAESLKILTEIATYTELRLQLDSLYRLINTINIEKEINSLKLQLDTLNLLKEEYNLIRETNTANDIDSLITISDSTGMSSLDTNFIDQLNLIFDQTTNDDDTIVHMVMVDTLINKLFIPDSLISSLDYFLTKVQKDSIIIWLNEIQNDTLDFYLVDVNRDSVHLQLYKNSPNIKNIEITDVWGKKHPALVRDIQKSSFRLIIDESAELNQVSVDKSKKALEKYSITNNAGFVTLTKRTVPKYFKPWSFHGNTNFNISQIAFHQWTLGGESSISLLWGTEFWWKYRRDRHQWNNHFKIKIGFIRQGEYTDNAAFFKSNEDHLEYITRYNYKIKPKLYGAFMVDFKTRTLASYDYPTDTTRILKSKFFSPAYITLSLGTEYRMNKKNIFYASPLAWKSTMVLDSEVNETNYGLTEGEWLRHELGINLIANTEFKVFDDIVIKNDINLFGNYLNLHNITDIDVRWDMEISMPVNNFIVTKITGSMIWDKDITVSKKQADGSYKDGTGIQIKERISVGLMIKF